MSHAEGHAQFAGGLDELIGFVEIQAKGLLAEDRNTRLHRLHRGIEVDKVGCDDEDVIEPLIFGHDPVRGDHFIVGAVTGDRVGPFGRFFQRDLGIGEKRPRHDPAGAVKVNRFLMRMDNERAASAAHQSDVERFV